MYPTVSYRLYKASQRQVYLAQVIENKCKMLRCGLRIWFPVLSSLQFILFLSRKAGDCLARVWVCSTVLCHHPCGKGNIIIPKLEFNGRDSLLAQYVTPKETTGSKLSMWANKSLYTSRNQENDSKNMLPPLSEYQKNIFIFHYYPTKFNLAAGV